MIQREKGNFSEYYDLREQNNDPRAMDTIIFTSSLLLAETLSFNLP